MGLLSGLFGGGGGNKQHQSEIALANKDPYSKKLKFTTEHGSQGVTNKVFENYVKAYDGPTKHYNTYWKAGAPKGRSQGNKGISMAEFGAMHWAKHGMKEGRSLSGPSRGGGGFGGGGGVQADPAVAAVNQQTKVLQDMVSAMKEQMEANKEVIKPETVSAPGEGLETTVSNAASSFASYVADKKKKRKSYLTPVALD